MNTNTKEPGDKRLEMSFDKNTIQHLGASMYSSMPPAIAELIANAYDADAENVTITIDNKSKKIIVEDDGIGMSFDDINSQFLVIGRNRRDEGKKKTNKNRYITGKKGLGKLALFGLANKIEIETSVKGSNQKVIFTMDWNKITYSGIINKYHPPSKTLDEDINKHYTRVTITELKRKSPINIEYLAEKISWLFNFIQNKSSQDKFEAKVIDQITSKYELINRATKYSVIKKIGIQKTWIIPDDYKINIRGEINGEIYACEKPIVSRYKGISLYANGRLVNAPGFFDISESGHFFSYISGWLEVDFIDDVKEDLISTNRQSLNWDNEYIVEIGLRVNLQKLLNSLQRKWRIIRKENSKAKVINNPKFDAIAWKNSMSLKYRYAISRFMVLLYRDGREKIKYEKLMQILHDYIIPNFPEFNLWYGLHENITGDEETAKLYKGGHYYSAVFEAVKVYMEEIKKLSDEEDDGYDLIRAAFNYEKSSPIEITNKQTETEKNIERANKYHALGVHFGFRNTNAHNSTGKIKKEDIISKEDCLNILSILSHLYNNLDKRKKPKPITDKP